MKNWIIKIILKIIDIFEPTEEMKFKSMEKLGYWIVKCMPNWARKRAFKKKEERLIKINDTREYVDLQPIDDKHIDLNEMAQEIVDYIQSMIVVYDYYVRYLVKKRAKIHFLWEAPIITILSVGGGEDKHIIKITFNEACKKYHTASNKKIEKMVNELIKILNTKYYHAFGIRDKFNIH